MGTTPNYSIPTPNDGDAWNLVADLDGMANVIDTAVKGVADTAQSNLTGVQTTLQGADTTLQNNITAARNEGLRTFADAPARDAAIPAPSQGVTVFLNDRGITSTYYGAWNASTNPGGRTPAGWYDAPRNVGLVPIVPPTIVKSGGSVEVNTAGLVSFAGVSSISLNNAFSDTYADYRVLLKIQPSALTGISFRFRASGTDLTTSTYYMPGRSDTSAGTGATYALSGTTYVEVGAGTSGGWAISSAIDIRSPKLTEYSRFTFQSAGHNGSQSTNYIGSVWNTTATQHDGFTLYSVNAGLTLTGTIQVFGYNV